MEVKYGAGQSKYGTGVQIDLTGDEVAIAIAAYLVTRRIHINGPRTIRVNGEQIQDGWIYVDPSGFVIHNGEKLDGRGPSTDAPETYTHKLYEVLQNHMRGASDGEALRAALESKVAVMYDTKAVRLYPIRDGKLVSISMGGMPSRKLNEDENRRIWEVSETLTPSSEG